MPPSALLTLAVLPALAGVVFLGHSVARWRRWRPEPHWRAATGRVLTPVRLSGLTASSIGGHATTYAVTRLAYEYDVGGLTYTAYLEQVPARPVRVPGRGRRAGGPLRVGGTLPVRYDPADPTRVVPDEHLEWGALASLTAGALALALAAWLVAGALRAA